METETHFVDIENYIFRTKIDLFKHSDQIVGFKVMCWERVIECQLDEDYNPIFSVRRLVDDDRPHIKKKVFQTLVNSGPMKRLKT